jgi:hypothetical protein
LNGKSNITLPDNGAGDAGLFKKRPVVINRHRHKHPSLFSLRELPKNNLRILFALLPVFYVVITGT